MLGSPFGPFFHHPDAPLPHFSPHHDLGLQGSRRLDRLEDDNEVTRADPHEATAPLLRALSAEERRIAEGATDAARKLERGALDLGDLRFDDIADTIADKARGDISRAQLIAAAAAEHGIGLKPANLAKVTGLSPEDATKVIAAARTSAREASAATAAVHAVDAIGGTRRLSGKQVDEAIDLFFNRFDGRASAMREAWDTLSKAEKKLLNNLVKDIQEYFAAEAKLVNETIKKSGRYANRLQLAYWQEHPNFANAIRAAAIEKIEAAATKHGNQAAQAFMAHLEAKNFRTSFDPRTRGLGYFDPDVPDEITVNPFFKDAVFTERRSRLRTIDDIASTLLHEFVHKEGHGELRAWFEQYRFLQQVGRQEAVKYGAAAQFAGEIAELGEISAIEALMKTIRGVYKDKYDTGTIWRSSSRPRPGNPIPSNPSRCRRRRCPGRGPCPRSSAPQPASGRPSSNGRGPRDANRLLKN